MAIELPESTKRLLVDLDPQIHGARWLDAEQLHLTLGFFGVVPEDVDLKLREKLSAIVFRRLFSADRRRWNISAERSAENYLDRRRTRTSASFPIAQTSAGSCARRWAGAGAAPVPSTRHARAMSADLAAIRAQISESECRS